MYIGVNGGYRLRLLEQQMEQQVRIGCLRRMPGVGRHGSRNSTYFLREAKGDLEGGMGSGGQAAHPKMSVESLERTTCDNDNMWGTGGLAADAPKQPATVPCGNSEAFCCS